MNFIDKETGDNFSGWTIGGRHFGGTYGNRRGETTEYRYNKACNGSGVEGKNSEKWSDPAFYKEKCQEQHNDSDRQEKGCDPGACKGTRSEQQKESAHQEKHYSEQRVDGAYEEKRSGQYSDASRQVDRTEQKKSSHTEQKMSSHTEQKTSHTEHKKSSSEIDNTEEVVHRSKPPMWEKLPPGAISYSYSYAPYHNPYTPPSYTYGGGYPPHGQMHGGDDYYGGYQGHGQGYYHGGSYAQRHQPGSYGMGHQYDGGHMNMGYRGGGAPNRAPGYGYGQHETVNRRGAHMKMGPETDGYGYAGAFAYYGHGSRAVHG